MILPRIEPGTIGMQGLHYNHYTTVLNIYKGQK